MPWGRQTEGAAAMHCVSPTEVAMYAAHAWVLIEHAAKRLQRLQQADWRHRRLPEPDRIPARLLAKGGRVGIIVVARRPYAVANQVGHWSVCDATRARKTERERERERERESLGPSR